MHNPLVSIVIPVYNGSNYMREAIDSALAQTYRNIEVIVVNDGSNDGGKTREIALSYGDRIRYFEKENGGVSTALNLAIQEMKGEFFSWLSHDDVYYPQKIQVQIDYINETNKHNIIVYSDWDCIDSKSQFICTTKVKHCDPSEFRLYFSCAGGLHGCTLLIPYECFERLGTFNPSLRYTQDFDLWFRFTYGYEFHHINSCLIMYRCHLEQGSFKRNLLYINECNNMYIGFLKKISFEEIRSTWPQSPSSYAIHFSSVMNMSENYRASLFAFWIAVLLFLRYPHINDVLKIAKLTLCIFKSLIPKRIRFYLKAILGRLVKK